MPHHEVEPVDVPGPITQGDKKSHLFSMLLGVGIGALTSSIVVLAVAIEGGQRGQAIFAVLGVLTGPHALFVFTLQLHLP